MIRSLFILILILFSAVILQSFWTQEPDKEPDFVLLRQQYEKPLDQWPAPHVDKDIAYQEWAPLPAPPIWNQKDAATQAKIALGKRLFFEPRLSASMQISCSSCHDPDMHWTDGRKKAIGSNHRIGRRHTPSLQNIWSQQLFFWDGRQDKLQQVARSPIEDPNEMNTPIDTALSHIHTIKGYRKWIQAAFGTDKMNADQLGEALSCFQQTISSNITRFDNFLKGRGRALSDQQIWGMHLFRTKARCFNCHNGPFLTDGKFHNLGFSNYGTKNQDLGRYEVTRNNADIGTFKTPGLRDAVRTFPWFHDGRFNNISMLLNQYNAGMPQPKARSGQETDSLYPVQSPHLQPLGITLKEREAIIRFLEALAAQPIEIERPQLPE
ncbi:cytochrome-c peroxidase [Sphingobacterium spiritivorum]|uniref:cytochrome-c peroxidase n=1 Tax=Sphingobacterium spiritivorum TaxID=258 RepID=UPI003DA69282